jgi:hypothetical protein
MNKLLNKNLVLSFLDNNEFYDAPKCECPECSYMEDEDYCCTTCWGNDLNFNTIVKALLSKNFNYEYSFDFNLEEILKENSDKYTFEGIRIFKSEYPNIDSKYFNEDNDFHINIPFYCIIMFLSKKNINCVIE